MSKKKNIDALDVAILNTLQEDASLTNQQLAHTVGLTPGPTLRRVRALLEKGALVGIHARISRKFFRYNFRAYVRFLITSKNQKDFVELLEGHNKVTEIHNILPASENEASETYMTVIEGYDFEDFKSILDEICRKSECVMNKEIMPIDQSIKYCGTLTLDEADVK
jgi:DNA-binding Lrp family transcriptional regulator